MTLMLALLLGSAQAQDCNPAAAKAAFEEASPVAVAAAWTRWAECDPDQAKKATAAAVEKMLAGDPAYAALATAIGFGETDTVTEWVRKQEAGHRSKAIASLGNTCSTDESVEAYLLKTPSTLKSDFWKERWYRAFATCRTDGVRKWITAALDEKAASDDPDDNDFTGILEVYSRNMGADAIPKLTELAGTVGSDDKMVYIVSSFADAANVGGKGGINGDAALKGTTAIIELAPKMGYRSVENARATLEALGAQANADAMAAYRWPDRLSDGQYTYSVAARELTTCKNGKRNGTFHHADLSEPGARWPEQVKVVLVDHLTREWEIGEFAAKCKGEFTVEFFVPSEPWADDDPKKADWLKEQRQGFQAETEGYDKRGPNPHDHFELF